MRKLTCFILFFWFAAVPAAHAQAPDAAIEEFFALAEHKLPDDFPPGSDTLRLDDYLYRYYPATRLYLAVAYDHVWLSGGQFGDEVVAAGELLTALAMLRDLPDPPSVANWTLTVSGTIYTDNSEFEETFEGASSAGRITFRNFDRFVQRDVQPIPFNDVEDFVSQFAFFLAGELVGIEVLFSAVVFDTVQRKSLAATFAVPHEKGVQTYYLFFDYVR